MGLMKYNERYKQYRKLSHQKMSARAVLEYRPIQEREALTFVVRLLDDPKEFIKHCSMCVLNQQPNCRLLTS